MSDDFETFRDHFLSLYQSAANEVAHRIDQRQQRFGERQRSSLARTVSSTLPGIAADIARREYSRARGLQLAPTESRQRKLSPGDAVRVCAELGYRYLRAQLNADANEILRIRDEFKASTCDPAWVTVIDEYLRYFGPNGSRKPIPYVRPSAVNSITIPLKPNAKVAILGDWGTGARPALQVLNNIAASKPDIIIHLGDIYYSGTPEECQSNFVSIISKVFRPEELPAVYTLAGNHDMYCGGVGYYDLIKKLNSEQEKQRASFFCLRSQDDKWQFLAMDTGLHDFNPLQVDDVVTFLEEEELIWHRERVQEFPGRTILLSHHQLFSAFSPIGGANKDGSRSAINHNLLAAFESLNLSGQVSAWFWGHEHTLSIYEPFAGLVRGRCLGHGAVPVNIRDNIYEPLAGLEKIPTIVPNTQLGREGSVYAHGYAVLTLKADACLAEYYQSLNGDGCLVYSEDLSTTVPLAAS